MDGPAPAAKTAPPTRSSASLAAAFPSAGKSAKSNPLKKRGTSPAHKDNQLQTPEEGVSQLRAGGNPEGKEEKMEPVQPRTSAKNCPECGQPLTPRTNRTTKTEFLGCSNWPTCKYTEPMPQDVIMRRMNHPELPGF